MKIIGFASIALSAGALLAGCAATQEQGHQTQPRENTTYTTGSRLPSSGGGAQAVGGVDKDTWMNNRREGAGNPYDRTQ